MKVNVAKIPPEGLDLDFEAAKSWLNDVLDPNDELRAYLCDSLECSCHLEMLRNDVFIKGKASLKLKPICSRCNGEFERIFTVLLDLTCIPDTRKKALRGQDYMDGDVGFNYYAGGELDLAKIAREQIMLTLPMTFLCNPDCRGLCHSCGANLNHEACRCDNKS